MDNILSVAETTGPFNLNSILLLPVVIMAILPKPRFLAVVSQQCSQRAVLLYSASLASVDQYANGQILMLALSWAQSFHQVEGERIVKTYTEKIPTSDPWF